MIGADGSPKRFDLAVGGIPTTYIEGSSIFAASETSNVKSNGN